jgi:uncharacterized protein
MMNIQQAVAQYDQTNCSLWPSPVDTTATRGAFLLQEEDETEVLSFLSERAAQTVSLRGFIRDNGLDSLLNRGAFYGYRNDSGKLEGVALIGHATLIEARTASAIAAFAKVAQECGRIHMVMGEQELVQSFWQYYAEVGQPLRLMCRELLMEKRSPVVVLQEVEGLRPATLKDLDAILPVQAGMAEEESGVNPLAVDPEGFRARCARRIKQGRTWVLVERGRLVFKADIMADTPEAIYVEGIFIHNDERGKGFGLRCLSQLDRMLLARTKSVCLLVNENNSTAKAFYQRSGYKFRGVYDTIFLGNQEA